MRPAAALLFLLLAAPRPESAVTGRVSALEGETQRRLRSKVRYAGPGVDKRKAPDPSPAVVWLEGVPAARAAAGKTAEIRQEGLEFRPRILAVQTGTTVKFPNADDLYHNVFSYSKPKRFDLGKYRKGESREVVFDAPGRVEVSCEVHEHMRAHVLVVDHPHFAVAAEDGSYRLPGVPPGRYTLVAWKEHFEPARREIVVTADGAQVDVPLSRVDEGRPRRLPAGCCGAR